jgi:hypothetical protein
MKKAAFFLMIVFASVNVFGQTKTVPTTSNVKIEKRELGTFNKVKTGKGINVTLVAGEKEGIEIQIQNGATSDILTEINGKTLTLKMKTKIYKDMAVRVYVTYKQLLDVYAGTGSSVDCDGAILGETINLTTETDASIEIEVYVKSLYATLSASRIELTGSTDYQEVKGYAGAHYNAGEFESKEAYIKVNTGALATISVSQKLVGSAATGSKISYYGNPDKIEKTESVGGKIEAVIAEK